MTAVALRHRPRDPATRGGLIPFLLAPALLALQILLGALNVWLGEHPALILAHLTLATVLWATVVQAAASLLAVPADARRGLAGLRGHRDPGGNRLTTMESATNTGKLAQPMGAPLAARRPLAAVLRDYLALTKPRIIVLLLVTTVATMFVADPSGPALATILWTMLGGYLAAGGAGAINHYLERDRDARMARTCGRPLVDRTDRAAPRARVRDRARGRWRSPSSRWRSTPWPRPWRSPGCSATCSCTRCG